MTSRIINNNYNTMVQTNSELAIHRDMYFLIYPETQCSHSSFLFQNNEITIMSSGALFVFETPNLRLQL